MLTCKLENSINLNKEALLLTKIFTQTKYIIQVLSLLKAFDYYSFLTLNWINRLKFSSKINQTRIMSSFSTKIVRLIKRQILVQIYVFCLFLISGLIVNFVQLLSCVIWPFNKKLYRRVNRFLASCFWSGKYFIITINIKIKFY